MLWWGAGTGEGPFFDEVAVAATNFLEPHKGESEGRGEEEEAEKEGEERLEQEQSYHVTVEFVQGVGELSKIYCCWIWICGPA
jgi:hypothetical protein